VVAKKWGFYDRARTQRAFEHRPSISEEGTASDGYSSNRYENAMASIPL